MEAYLQLEADWAKFNGLDPAGMVACSSGTAALHLALEAPRLPRGNTAFCGDFNMIAVPRAIAMAGLVPVFVDCDDRLNMDIRLLDGFDKDYVHTAVMTHVYGRRGDADRLARWAGENLRLTWLVEDLAEAHGVRPYPDTDAACWSFYRNKIVAGEEGGAVWFRDPAHAALARQLRSLGFTADHDYNHVPRGHNYRLSNMHAAYILERSNDFGCNPNALDQYTVGFRGKTTKEARREIEGWYEAACPPEWRMPARDAVWVYDVRLPVKAVTFCSEPTDPCYGLPSYDRLDVIVTELKRQGIEARHAFKPMSRQTEFRNCRRVLAAGARSDVSVADMMSCRVLYLPVQPGRTTEADCVRAFAVLRDALGGAAG